MLDGVFQESDFDAVTGVTASDASLSGHFKLETTYMGPLTLRAEFDLTAPVAFFGPLTFQLIYFQLEEPAMAAEDDGHDHRRLEVTGTGTFEGSALLFQAPDA